MRNTKNDSAKHVHEKSTKGDRACGSKNHHTEQCCHTALNDGSDFGQQWQEQPRTTPQLPKCYGHQSHALTLSFQAGIGGSLLTLCQSYST